MKHTRHLLIAALIVVVVGAGGAFVLSLGVPASFGWRDGWQYRGDSLEEQKNIPFRFAGDGACLRPECHGDKAKEEYQVALGGGHKAVACEACHGPASIHVDTMGKEDKPTASKEPALCMTCHAKVVARPAAVKQIDDFESHRKIMGGDKETTCVDCHDSHTGETE
jgi:hypothetical protein